MGRFKSFIASIWHFIKLKPIVAVIPAISLGTAAAIAVTVLAVNHFKNSEGSGYYFPSMSSYVSSAPDTLNQTSDIQEVSSVVSVAASVIQPIKKKVAYKGKDINVAAVEVAKPDSVEDSENGSYVKETPEQGAPVTPVIPTTFFGGSKASTERYTYGIDVSSHNKAIDWAAVKASNVKFAMIRCGYRGYLTGKIVMDSSFEYNIENAYKNGISVGVYFYSTATNELEAMEEAAYVVELVKAKAQIGIKLSYPIAYDFEEFYNTDDRSRAKFLSKSQISSDASAFLEYIKSSGYNPMFYAGKNPMKNNFESYLASKYNFWLANYANATEYAGKFFMWQFTSSGSINGIAGRVDFNVQGFRNNDNLPRFSICQKSGVAGYKSPTLSSEQVLTLTANEIYPYRNTYTDEFKEIKVGKVYCYVQTADLFAPFETTKQKYKTNTAEQTYKYPIADNSYKTGNLIPAGTELEVRGVWGNSWIEVKYGGNVCYVMVNNLANIGDVSPADTPNNTNSSSSSSADDTTSKDSSTDSSLNSNSSDSFTSGNASDDSLPSASSEDDISEDTETKNSSSDSLTSEQLNASLNESKSS